MMKIISKFTFETWLGLFALIGFVVSENETLAILAGIYLSTSKILLEIRKGITR